MKIHREFKRNPSSQELYPNQDSTSSNPPAKTELETPLDPDPGWFLLARFFLPRQGFLDKAATPYAPLCNRTQLNGSRLCKSAFRLGRPNHQIRFDNPTQPGSD